MCVCVGGGGWGRESHRAKLARLSRRSSLRAPQSCVRDVDVVLLPTPSPYPARGLHVAISSVASCMGASVSSIRIVRDTRTHVQHVHVCGLWWGMQARVAVDVIRRCHPRAERGIVRCFHACCAACTSTRRTGAFHVTAGMSGVRLHTDGFVSGNGRYLPVGMCGPMCECTNAMTAKFGSSVFCTLIPSRINRIACMQRQTHHLTSTL